ncbi:hypothetical protein BS78_09G176800 [Paspalum vaginatum]|nr:hypothetical protein BS78_09G176800 [Paspalum vaginatum]
MRAEGAWWRGARGGEAGHVHSSFPRRRARPVSFAAASAGPAAASCSEPAGRCMHVPFFSIVHASPAHLLPRASACAVQVPAEPKN